MRASGEFVWERGFSLDTPIMNLREQVICQGCCCPMVDFRITVYADGKAAQLFTCPHLDIWVRPSTGLLHATTKGVRH